MINQSHYKWPCRVLWDELTSLDLLHISQILGWIEGGCERCVQSTPLCWWQSRQGTGLSRASQRVQGAIEVPVDCICDIHHSVLVRDHCLAVHLWWCIDTLHHSSHQSRELSLHPAEMCNWDESNSNYTLHWCVIGSLLNYYTKLHTNGMRASPLVFITTSMEIQGGIGTTLKF